MYVSKFKEWINEKKIQATAVGKDPEAYAKRKEINEFKQKRVSLSEDDKVKKLKLKVEEKKLKQKNIARKLKNRGAQLKKLETNSS